jgi:hypothetical protein
MFILYKYIISYRKVNIWVRFSLVKKINIIIVKDFSNVCKIGQINKLKVTTKYKYSQW